MNPGFHVVLADPGHADRGAGGDCVTEVRFLAWRRRPRRNKALIVFPASIRWGRRLDRLFPGLSDRLLLRQMRALRRYRTADEPVLR